MPSPSQIAEFVRSTGEKTKNDPKTIINDAGKHSYVLRRMLKNADHAKVFQAGKRIKCFVQLRDPDNAQFYRPRQAMDVTDTDVTEVVYTDWRFLAQSWMYDEELEDMNDGNEEVQLIDYVMAKRQGASTSLLNRMDTHMFATPNKADMEGFNANAYVPYSIPVFVTTGAGGKIPHQYTSGDTVLGLDPDEHPRWRNQQATYDPGKPGDGPDGLISAFDDIWLDTKFETPGEDEEYFTASAHKKMCIETTKDGIKLYARLTREANDRLVGRDFGHDVANPSYSGIRLHRAEGLETATGILADDNNTLTATTPVFYFLNLEFFYPIYHTKRYMKERAPRPMEFQPFSHIVWKNLYYNLMCESRWRQGVVFPIAA